MLSDSKICAVLLSCLLRFVSAEEHDKSDQTHEGTLGRIRPNIVFMMVDNFGYGDLGSYGGGVLRGAPTPRLDRLARQGLRLTNYNVEPECTPSRSALMTGRMPIRSGTASVAGLGSADGLAPCEYTLAELLSDAGYSTALYGKWHLGSAQNQLPNSRGFDEWYGIPRTSNEAVCNMQPGFKTGIPLQQVLRGVRGENSTEVCVYDYDARSRIDYNLTKLAVDYIHSHSIGKKPFFLYVPFTLPHSPPLPHPDFANPDRTQYQNVLAEIDHNAGRVIDAVDVAGIVNNTIVIFTSDNGPETLQGITVSYGAQSDSGPFRGEFPSGWEGAIRVPFIIRWPGHIEAGRVSNEIVSILDMYRTFSSIAGAQHLVPTNRPIDSIDQSDFFFEGKETSNRNSIMFFHDGDLLAIKYERFKMHLKVRNTATGTVVTAGQQVYHGMKVELNKPWIFDIENDPKELWNIAAMNPWLGRVAAPIEQAYSESVAKCPNIVQPGSHTCPWLDSTNESFQTVAV